MKLSLPVRRSPLGLLTPAVRFSGVNQVRWLHKSKSPQPVPSPRPFVPDVQTFLTLIGRGLGKQASKFPSWESLFSLDSNGMRELGIEPARTRRYLLNWLYRYRRGSLGPGGDFEYVHDGKALLKVATPPPGAVSEAKWVVNVPLEDAGVDKSPAKLVRPIGYKVQGLNTICGSFVENLPDDKGAVVKVREGMWEVARGRKIDGGERRRAEVRFKKRSAERRAQREADIMSKL
ncbi:Protein FYV4 [Paramyrothecium foliicola]|nr:Protein FYV4 [Paramyrothecium foliicola]